MHVKLSAKRNSISHYDPHLTKLSPGELEGVLYLRPEAFRSQVHTYERVRPVTRHGTSAITPIRFVFSTFSTFLLGIYLDKSRTNPKGIRFHSYWCRHGRVRYRDTTIGDQRNSFSHRSWRFVSLTRKAI